MANVLLIVYDNGSHIPFFPQGIAYLAGSLRKEGHNVKLWLQDITHKPETHLTAYLDRMEFDIVGLGFCAGYYQYEKCLRISQAVNASKNRSKFRFVLGGHGPAAEPEYFLDKYEADRVIIGEGETQLCDYIADKRISSAMILCDGRNLSYPHPDFLPWPAYELFPTQIYRLIRWPTSIREDFCFPILTGRGCKWKCTFCYRMDEGFRPRDPEAVLDEIDFLIHKYGITHFQFSDELFMSSTQRIQAFCEAILRYPIKFKWDCNGRLNYATKDNLAIMKRAGCEYINYGIESLNQNILNEMKKGLTVEQIYIGTENTLAQGLTPGLNIIFGFPGDTEQNLVKAMDFLVQYDTHAELRTIRPVTPYPGSELYKLAQDRGLLAGPADFYENKHVNSDLLTVNFTDMSDEEVHQALAACNTNLLSYYVKDHKDKQIKEIYDFYRGKNSGFRGFRAV